MCVSYAVRVGDATANLRAEQLRDSRKKIEVTDARYVAVPPVSDVRLARNKCEFNSVSVE